MSPRRALNLAGSNLLGPGIAVLILGLWIAAVILLAAGIGLCVISDRLPGPYLRPAVGGDR